MLDAAAGLAFLLLGIVMRSEAARYSWVCAAAGAAWLLAGVVPGTTWLHRPLLVWAVLSFPDGRLRRLADVVVVGASGVIAVPALAISPWAMAVVGAGVAGLGAAQLHRSRSWPTASGRARGWAALCVGAAFLVHRGRACSTT